MNGNSRPLAVQSLADWFCRLFRQEKVPFLSSLCFGLLAYAYAFANKLPNHDDVSQLFAKGATVSSGRFGLGALNLILPNYSMPWLYGVMTLVLVAMAVCLILHMLQIRTPLIQVLAAGCITVFPSLIGLFGYMFTSSAYGIAFLLAAGAAWLASRGKVWYGILSVGLLAGSLSIYQGYLSVAASLLVIALIRDLLKGEKALQMVKRGIFYVAVLLAGLVLYSIANKAVMALKSEGFNDYAAGAMEFGISGILTGVGKAYGKFWGYFARRELGLIPTASGQLAHGLLLVCCAGGLGLWGKQKGTVPELLLLAALLGILPLAINCMYLVIEEEAIHTLVMYSVAMLYALAAVIFEAVLPLGKKPGRLCLDLLAASLAMILTVNTYVANEAWLNMQLRYENACALYTSVLARLQELPEFQPGCTLAVLGTYEEQSFYQEEFGHLSEITGVKGIRPDDYSAEEFLRYYLGVSCDFATEEEKQSLQETEQFQAMGCYPYYGCIQVIENTIVVRLS